MEGGNGSILVQSVECFPAQVAIPQNVLVYEIALAPSVFIVVLVHPTYIKKKKNLRWELLKYVSVKGKGCFNILIFLTSIT